MKYNWLVVVSNENDERQTYRVRAGNDRGAQQKVLNEHPDVKILQVHPDGR